MVISSAVRDNLTVSIVSLFAGVLLTNAVTTILAKTKHLRYSTRVNRLALSTDDAVFGSVRATWNSKSVRNLYMAWVEVENTSNRDFEKVDFKIYVANETFLLNDRTAVMAAPYAVQWSPEYKASLEVAPGALPTERQQFRYDHSREYLLSVFNRGQVLQFTYLCSRPNDDLEPGVFVSTTLKGAKLKHQ